MGMMAKAMDAAVRVVMAGAAGVMPSAIYQGLYDIPGDYFQLTALGGAGSDGGNGGNGCIVIYY